MMTDLVTFWHLSSSWLPIIRLILHQNWSNSRLDTLNDTVSALIRNKILWESGKVGEWDPALLVCVANDLKVYQSSRC